LLTLPAPTPPTAGLFATTIFRTYCRSMGNGTTSSYPGTSRGETGFLKTTEEGWVRRVRWRERRREEPPVGEIIGPVWEVRGGRV